MGTTETTKGREQNTESPQRSSFVICFVFSVVSVVAACGGGGGNGGPSDGGQNPPPGRSNQNPCATAALEDEQLGLREGEVDRPRRDKTRLDGSQPWRVLDDLYAHRAARLRGEALTVPEPNNQDVGDIAVLQDQGDLILKANRFDLAGTGLRFTRSGSGYQVQHIDAVFRQTLGTRLTLTDDDSRAQTVPFSFPFYGHGETAAFVNSDGNITFGEEDKASTDRNITRMLTGPPRVSPFFSDLDPSTGGSVWVNAAAGEFTVTWCGVKGFESSRLVTAQATMLPDGSVEIQIAPDTTLPDAIVALSPGHTGNFTPVDLSTQGPTSGGDDAAVGERFSERGSLDTVAVARKFYRTHADRYDQLIMWTDTRLQTTSFAYESTVKNEIHGIGIDVYDIAKEFGSRGALRSIVNMDTLEKYPDDPYGRVIGQNNTLSLLGQESGHRWLAFLRFRDANGRASDALLGRDQAHWSFFMDSDGSVMEGNDWEELGGGKFRTRDPVRRYSRLDQYAMGLLGEGQVPSFFYIESPVNTNKGADDPPISAGFELTGTKRVVPLQGIIDVMGARRPSAADSPRVHRQAFIYVVSTASADPKRVAKLERIRKAWTPFFFEATENRMRLESRLAP